MSARAQPPPRPASNKDIGIRVLEGKDYFFPRVRTLFIGLLIVVGLVLLVALTSEFH